MNSVNPSERNGSRTTSPTWGKVIPFPGKVHVRSRRTVALFSMRDRMAALDWAEKARVLGITRLVVEAPDDRGLDDSGEFILIYERSTLWASWGIGFDHLGMILWRSACGTTIGYYETLPEALATLRNLIGKPTAFAA